MSYENQSIDQLIIKLKAAQLEVSHLKREQHIKAAIEKEKSNIEHALRERIKELDCLYGVTELIEENEREMEFAMQGIVDLLIISWQYPEITTARIVLKNQEYKTNNFQSSPWRQAADIQESGEKIGLVEVCYLEKMPDIYEGPFLKEERLLINAVAIRIGSAVDRISAKRQLEIERKSLQNANIALKEILTRVNEEKTEIGKVIMANIDKTIVPILHALDSELYPSQKKYIAMIQKSLEDITSPFINKLTHQFMELTASEIQICNLIKNGLSTKEIAEMRHISSATVNRHRENIRKKLGLKNKKINLPTFLQTHMSV
jgi:Bacterial regulatory proteins, luxR family